MVLNIEQKPGRLIISYINTEGKVSYLQLNVPSSHQFSYVYCKQKSRAHPGLKSWDGKDVARVPAQFLNKHRLQEFFIDAGEEHTKQLFDRNMPDLYACDIEVDVTDEGFAEPEDAKNRINSIAWVRHPDCYVFGLKPLSGEECDQIEKKINDHVKKSGKEYKFIYKQYKNEADMLYDFLYNYARHAPLITGWFFWGYDWDYIYNRCTKRLNMDISFMSPTSQWYEHTIKIKGKKRKIMLPYHKLIVDYLAIYKKWDRTVDVKENDTLDFVSNAALGISKIKYPGTFQELFNKDYDIHVFYNAVDAILIELLDEKLKTMNTFLGLGNITRVEAMSAFSPIQMLEATLTRYAYKRNQIFPKNFERKEREHFEGAFVYEPIPNLYEWVAAFDFASLYPTIMRQWMISIENFIVKDKLFVANNNQIKTSSGAVFDASYEPLIPEILSNYYGQRKKAKRISQEADMEFAELKKIKKERLNTTI
jgi:DNA polymerase elongation subunit (family B)